MPDALTLGDRITSNPPSPFELTRHSSFDYDLEALPTGQIRGHVVGPDGKPLTTASVALYRAEGFAPGGAGLFTSQVEGKPFDFLHLPPGDYLVVFTGTSPDAPFPPTFYPDAPDSQAATAIHLSDGQQMSDVEIHVKGAIPTRNITVRLHWNGRTPSDYYPPHVIVEASEGKPPHPFSPAPDTYALNLFLTARYTIHAQTFCRSGAKGAVDTPALTVDGADSSVSTVDLTFGKGQCPPK